ncbi:putative zinc-binding protein [Cupriavidus basilensis]|uniref:putative zinc-binding protein n=1 Tax=Cupriavidus TaxID=106589 RepID=UPI000450FE67|nr:MULTISPECIES: putative zinc-binding protein [Cupriavidus]KDP88923.1 zinc-binding protein [Cupriavidus sp. SK-3]MDF3888016.1 putative zinc-binding protein [Cupriavidus basilensis]
MPKAGTTSLPLVYACSGCSSVAQLANAFAVRLDRGGMAEMSCISGVGGGVAALTRVARSGRPILALDGCPLACVKACLAGAGVEPDQHLVLNRLGATKRQHGECSEAEAGAAWQAVTSALSAIKDASPPSADKPAALAEAEADKMRQNSLE